MNSDDIHLNIGPAWKPNPTIRKKPTGKRKPIYDLIPREKITRAERERLRQAEMKMQRFERIAKGHWAWEYIKIEDLQKDQLYYITLLSNTIRELVAAQIITPAQSAQVLRYIQDKLEKKKQKRKL